jgi:hypothetical protein
MCIPYSPSPDIRFSVLPQGEGSEFYPSESGSSRKLVVDTAVNGNKIKGRVRIHVGPEFLQKGLVMSRFKAYIG